MCGRKRSVTESVWTTVMALPVKAVCWPLASIFQGALAVPSGGHRQNSEKDREKVSISTCQTWKLRLSGERCFAFGRLVTKFCL